jgi:ceramide glucosyltransferase
MALELLLVLVLFIHSRHHIRQSFPEGRPKGSVVTTGPWPTFPKVALIVPLTGNSPDMRPALESLFHQDYPDYETILVTRDLADPATSLVRQVLSRHYRGRHLVSGPASRCCQKNHNILAAIRAVDDSVDILVFCDSTHRAPSNFLRELIHPLVTGVAVMTTGFHRIIPGDARVATLGMLQTVLTLHLIHGFRRLVMPWGGATAILRSAFRDFGVDRVWREAILDDLPLGRHLLRFGIRVTSTPSAILETDLAGQTMKDWNIWVTRQMLYVKYCLPSLWLAAALAVWLLAGPILLAALAALGGLNGLVAPPLALVSLGFLLVLTAMGAWCRTLVPQPVPLGPWLLAFYANIFMACWSYLKTWTTGTISWRGISYRVAWGGRVREILNKR